MGSWRLAVAAAPLLVGFVLLHAAVEVQSWRPPQPAFGRVVRPAPFLVRSTAEPSGATAASASAGVGAQQPTQPPEPPQPPQPLSPLPPLMEGDVVEYIIRDRRQLPPGDTRVLGLGVVNAQGHLHPLCLRKAEEPLLYYDEDQDALEDPLDTIVTRVFERVSLSQRCIEDRRINPHGEEAEDVFEIEEELSAGCGPAIRFEE